MSQNEVSDKNSKNFVLKLSNKKIVPELIKTVENYCHIKVRIVQNK